MLSPFHRLALKPVSRTDTSTIFGAQFVTPDQHGIFSFRVNYKRPFFTAIEEKHEVTSAISLMMSSLAAGLSPAAGSGSPVFGRSLEGSLPS